MSELIGFGLILLASILLLVMTILKRKSPPTFRGIAALARLKRSAGLAVEDGSRMHISLGRGSLLTQGGAASFAGLALLRHLAEQTSLSDRPPIATSGDATLAVLSQDTMRSAYRAATAEELYKASNGRLSGLTPFSYAAGAMPILRDEQVSTNVLIGDFGPEIALLTDAAERENALLVAGASDPAAQAVIFASTTEPLVGEELFAAPAYIGKDTSQRASMQVQDILRWVVIAALLAGAGLKLVGVL